MILKWDRDYFPKFYKVMKQRLRRVELPVQFRTASSNSTMLKSLKIPNAMLMFTQLPVFLARKHQGGKWLAKKYIPGRGDPLGSYSG